MHLLTKRRKERDIRKKPEKVEYWVSDLCALIAADIKRILEIEIKEKKSDAKLTFGYASNEIGDGKFGVDIVLGSDHGGGKSRLVSKINLTSSQSRRDFNKIEHGSRTFQFGNIDCKKDKAEILALIAPSVNETMERLKNGMLVGVKDEKNNLEVLFLPKNVKASLTTLKRDGKVHLQWTQEEGGSEILKVFELKNLDTDDNQTYHIWTVVDNFVHFVCGDLAFLATIQGRDETSHCRCPWCDLSSKEWNKKDQSREGRPLTLDCLTSYGQKALQYCNDLTAARGARRAATAVTTTATVTAAVAPTIAADVAPTTTDATTTTDTPTRRGRGWLPPKPDTKGVKSMPQWKIEPRRLIVPLLHLEIGLLNKAWTCLNDYFDVYVENIPQEERNLRENLREKRETLAKLEDEHDLTFVQKQTAYKQLSSLRKQLSAVKTDSKRKRPAPTPEQKSILKQRQAQLEDAIKLKINLIKDLKKELEKMKDEKARIKVYITNISDSIKSAKQKRIGDEDGLDSHVEKILAETAKIYPQAFHGGQMNGVCCLRFLNNVEEIMDKVRGKASERLKGREANGDNENMCTDVQLTKVVDDYTNLFRVMDLSFSLLRTPAPTEDEINEARKAIFVLEKLWRNLNINITPKAHVLFVHAVDQFEMFGGIADKVEDFVEKSHQLGKQLDHLTARMPKQCYRQQQLIHIKRMWLQQHPAIQKQILVASTFSKRKVKDVEKRWKKSKLNAKKSMRVTKKEEAKTFICILD